MRTYFGSSGKPLLTSVIYGTSPKECLSQMQSSLNDGADAFCFDLGLLPLEDHNEATLRQIFHAALGRPIYTYHYRRADRSHLTDDDLATTQLLCARCGGTLCDLMGDLFDRGALQELTKSPAAVAKQQQYIGQIHELGGKVLISTHIHAFLSPDQTLEQALEMERRGADVVKIVAKADSLDQMDDIFHTTMLLRKELRVPFLHLCMGEYGRIHRVLTPVFGSCMTLCVPYYTTYSVFDQPLLRTARSVYDQLTAAAPGTLYREI